MNRFFHEKIEPSVQSLPVMRVIHGESHNGRAFRLTQTVKRNVYTDFDRCLSRHLAASGGDAFPAFTVAVEVADTTGKNPNRHLVSGFHDSVPHALKELALRAFERAGPVELSFYSSNLKAEPDPSMAQKRMIGEADIDTMQHALAICRSLGDGEFIDIAGEFGMIIATPPGNLDPVILHLNHGTVQVPSSTTRGSTPFKWPIFTYFDHAATNLAAQSYIAGVNQALLAEKELAIREFRSIAERRIMDFYNALDGRQLRDHWLESADDLLARLKVGLGKSFVGISETARGIAMDLAEALEGAAPKKSNDRARNTHSLA